jgi:hypothetical protein
LVLVAAVAYISLGSSGRGPAEGTGTSSVHFSVEFTASFANSTYTFAPPTGETADFYLSLTLNVTCSGCEFSGDYRAPYQSVSAPVSGSGSKSYSFSSFDSPLSLAWSISKSSAPGTLTVLVTGSSGQKLYERSTSALNGTLTGVWSIAVARGS